MISCAHLPLDRADGALGGQHVLVARRLAHQQLSLGVESHDRRQDRVAVLFENDGPAVADDRDLAVGRSQIDADDRVCIHARYPSLRPGQAGS